MKNDCDSAWALFTPTSQKGLSGRNGRRCRTLFGGDVQTVDTQTLVDWKERQRRLHTVYRSRGPELQYKDGRRNAIPLPGNACRTSFSRCSVPSPRSWEDNKSHSGVSRGDWKVSESESVRIGKCQNRKVSELGSVRNCSVWKVSELESVRTYLDWKVSELQSVRNGWDWKVSEIAQIGKCQKLLGLEQTSYRENRLLKTYNLGAAIRLTPVVLHYKKCWTSEKLGSGRRLGYYCITKYHIKLRRKKWRIKLKGRNVRWKSGFSF